MDTQVATRGGKWESIRLSLGLSGALQSFCLGSSFSLWLDWTGTWDQIFEPSLLSCVYLRKPLALKLGPGLVL